MKKLLMIGMLGLVGNAGAANAKDTATFVKSMVATPEKSGAFCMKAAKSTTCSWEKTKWFESAEAVFRAPGFYTVIFSNPSFKLSDFGINAGPGIAKWKITSGPLSTSFIQEVALNGGRQINLQSALAHATLK